MMDFVIFNERQIITEANKIIIKIDNEVQQQQLQQMRFGLIDFLREHTGNNYAIESEILKSAEQKKRLYTSSDKYQFLVEKYPALEELKRKLGLEIDF